MPLSGYTELSDILIGGWGCRFSKFLWVSYPKRHAMASHSVVFKTKAFFQTMNMKIFGSVSMRMAVKSSVSAFEYGWL